MPEPLTGMRGTFEPCPMDAPCENCDHPMRGHFHETPNSFATACGECSCQHWSCRHGGTRTGVRT